MTVRSQPFEAFNKKPFIKKRKSTLNQSKYESYDVIIIGAGGAGLMCAIEAGKRGRRVLLIDHNREIGRKILISGGGRCNFTNLGANPDCYVSNNKHFVKSALSRYTPQDFIKLVQKHHIRYHEKKLGQLFCDESASQIVDMLVKECRQAGVAFALGEKVRSVKKDTDQGFLIEGETKEWQCLSLVIATGGLSIPQIGATGFGYDIARQFGLKITELAPALDGFDWRQGDLKGFTELAGVSLDVEISVNKVSFRENILFTHKGLSGPASLQASLYWKRDNSLSINLLPTMDAGQYLLEQKQKRGKQEVKNVLSDVLPKRFAEYFTEHLHVAGPLASLDGKRMQLLAANLNNWQVKPEKTVGYKKAEVTRGGVDTAALSSTTMETKSVPGLYFIGEVVDVTGRLGGYNFQWAWASGYAAGQSV